MAARIDTTAKNNPQLKTQKLKDGRISLYLEYYVGRQQMPIVNEYGDPVLYETGKMKGTPKFKVSHIRRKETLDLYLVDKPRTPIERQQNKEIIEIANKIRFEREQEFLEDKTGYRLQKDRQINFLDFYQTYIDNYTKKDIRNIKLSFSRFMDFLSETPEYMKYTRCIKPEQLTKDMMLDFTEYLQSRSTGEGALTLYKRFKKVINYAIEHDVLSKNPCKGVTITVDEQVLKKDVLSPEEIIKLTSTHYQNENPIIRRAFIISLYCGLRFCDVKDLTFENVDYANKLLKFEQSKTKGHSANSGVIIPLNDDLVELIGKPGKGESKETLIFPLPSHTMCLKALRHWTKRAGIEKHITWHCGRHSFAVNILNNGANIKTVASLLGHSGLKHTEKYTRAVDSLKKDAINSLPKLKL